MTEAEFFAFILSGIRRFTFTWRPRTEALNEARRTCTGSDKRTKYEYQCKFCENWFKRKEVDLDHIVACGGVTNFNHIAGCYERSLCEKDGFRVLCKECHLKHTLQQRKDKKL